MAHGHAIKLLDGEGFCDVLHCEDQAQYVVSFSIPDRKAEHRVERHYCFCHGLRFGQKYNLLEWRGDALYAKHPVGQSTLEKK